jgi:hypothetical protein
MEEDMAETMKILLFVHLALLDMLLLCNKDAARNLSNKDAARNLCNNAALEEEQCLCTHHQIHLQKMKLLLEESL